MSLAALDTASTPTERLASVLALLRDKIHALPAEHAAALAPLADEAHALAGGYDAYLGAVSDAPPPIVEAIVEKGNATDWAALHAAGATQFQLIPEMTAGGYEAVVLTHFARMAKAKTVLEIGMFTGTSTVALASVPGVARVVALELEPFLAAHNAPAFAQAGVAHKIDVRIGDAHGALSALAAEGAAFDMIFVDADKTGYTRYFERVLELGLLAPGGFMAVDNTAYKGAPWAPDAQYAMGAAVHAFNEAVKKDARVEQVLLPIRDGITLIRRKGE